jgi:RHS repeat-associated protein
VDQIVSVSESGRGATQYVYDNRGNMVSAHDANGEVTYRMRDLVGNIYYGPDSHDRRYGPGGLLETGEGINYVYDEEGRLIERFDTGGATWRYCWNGTGLLSEVERPDGKCVRFEYDALARRTRKTLVRPNKDGDIMEDEIRYFWDRHLLVHEVSNTVGTVTWYWDPKADVLVGCERAGRCWTVVSDHLGTPTEMYDDSGALTWKMRLDIHGQPSFEMGSAADCPFRWPGQYHDQETGLYCNRYRYYDPQIGAYISPDPLRLQGGLNLFGYVDDVNTQFDPFGLHVIEAFLDGEPVINPATGHNWWPNVPGSGSFPPAASGYGRLGDSENLLMEHLAQQGREALEGKRLEINSLGEPRLEPPRSPLPPCPHCDPGLQKFADDFGVNIHYEPEGQGRGGDYAPCGS